MERRDYIFIILEYLWKVITFKYVPHVLFTISVIMLFLTFVFMFKNMSVTRFLIKDKLRFMKQYIYSFVKQKYLFLLSFFKEVYKVLDKVKIAYIVVSIILIIVIAVYLFTKYG